MAVSIVTCNTFRADILNGVHQPGDVYKVALFTSAIGLDANTTAYSIANEVAQNSGTRYTTGGQTMTGRIAVLDSGFGVLSWDNPVWANSSIQANAALVYNASKSNKAIVAIDFGGTFETRAGPFTIKFPPATGQQALVTIA